ncbi:DUF3667 domain-containing protein [Massilia arenosa]|uniref:DUF3667 domain-containing protein n=1 Tax=Zemynaea arenosa TaxID=2561931 RepID=A0A4Y9S7T9_9BURK|nr:DUF3667 domain-containing protein [Massilia arenosa]TFW17366.1 DUF3667 domain-containing protein [Massilia arenosa]
MNIQFEAAGDLLAAGLVAKTVEGEGEHAHGDAVHACANCQTPITGKFCSNCGQSGHIHRSVLHLGEELLHGVLHFDAKGWRTLPLLVFRPGQLTRRYIDGQRTRFVSPLALFLFMIFVMFFTLSSTSSTNLEKGIKTSINKTAIADLEASERAAAAALVQAKAAVAAASKSGADVEKAEDALEKAQENHNDALEAVTEAKSALSLTGVSTDPAAAEKAIDAAVKDKADKAAVKKALKDAMKGKAASSEDGSGNHFNIKGSNINVNTGIGWVDRAAAHAKENPELTLYKLKNAASKYSFLLVPITLPFLWLMFFWKRGVTMYDHAVFSLYSLCFMALLMSTVAVVGYAGWSGLAGSLAVFVPPVHMFAQLKGAYSLSRFGAFWRTCMLLLVAAFVLAIYALTIIALSVA